MKRDRGRDKTEVERERERKEVVTKCGRKIKGDMRRKRV